MMDGKVWAFTAGITHPDGTDVYVSLTVPAEIAVHWRHQVETTEPSSSARIEPVLECSELVQMGALRAMHGYAATKKAVLSREIPF